jgi:hypothetical protein
MKTPVTPLHPGGRRRPSRPDSTASSVATPPRRQPRACPSRWRALSRGRRERLRSPGSMPRPEASRLAVARFPDAPGSVGPRSTEPGNGRPSPSRSDAPTPRRSLQPTLKPIQAQREESQDIPLVLGGQASRLSRRAQRKGHAPHNAPSLTGGWLCAEDACHTFLPPTLPAGTALSRYDPLQSRTQFLGRLWCVLESPALGRSQAVSG